MTDRAAQQVDELVAVFESVPVPAPGDRVDLEAAEALVAWGSHPYVCAWGGELSQKFVKAYLAALVAEVEELRVNREFWRSLYAALDAHKERTERTPAPPSLRNHAQDGTL